VCAQFHLDGKAQAWVGLGSRYTFVQGGLRPKLLERFSMHQSRNHYSDHCLQADAK
jgi:hypothetical protein